MKIIAVYDNEGKTIDRYTVVFDELYNEYIYGKKMKTCLSMSYNPEHPQGISQFSSCMLGRHLGKKISFEDLPEHIQKHVQWRIKEDD